MQRVLFQFFANGTVASLTAALLLLAGPGGCARNPVTGRPEAVLTSEASEIEQGERGAREIEELFGLVSDPALNAYVQAVGRRLAENAPRQNLEYRFFVVEMPEPNAFALPGGYIYVSRGLLALLNSEDELANVLGHEIGHVAARHSVARQTRSVPLIPVQIAAALGGMAASIVSPRLGSLIADTGQLPGALAMASYNRSQEREADRLGQDYAAAGGWSPAALGDFMQTLAREEALAKDAPHRISFLASHPSSPERSQACREYAQQLVPASLPPIAADRAAFLGRLDGLVVGERASDGVFVENRFVQPDMGFGIRFPEQWKQQNSRSAVTAQRPDASAIVALRLAGQGEDPLAAARAFARENSVRQAPRSLSIGGLAAAEIETQSGSKLSASGVYVAWIASGGLVYQIAGVCPARQYRELRPVFAAAAASFHELTDAERAEVRELRLRLVHAQGDESLADLLVRGQAAWGPEQAAVANALDPAARLPAGHPVKIARAEPYVPVPASTSQPSSSPARPGVR